MLTLTGGAATSNTLASALADGPASNDKLSLNDNATKWSLASTNIYSGNTSITNKLLKGAGMVFGLMGIAANATVAPDNRIGTLNASSISFDAATSSYNPEIDFGGMPSSDLLNVTGTVAFNNSSLDLATLNVPVPNGFSGPETFIIVANDGSDAVTGVFGTINNPPAGYTAAINYGFTGTDAVGRTSDGNDVAITISTIPVPEPSSFVLVAMSVLLGLLIVRRRTAK